MCGYGCNNGIMIRFNAIDDNSGINWLKLCVWQLEMHAQLIALGGCDAGKCSFEHDTRLK